MTAPYKLHNSGGVIRAADNALIPPDEGNCGWKIYQQWLGEGNTPDPEFTIDELRNLAIANISEVSNGRIDAVIGSDTRGKLTKLMSGTLLTRKEAKGQASPQEVAALDELQNTALYVQACQAEAETWTTWANDPSRTYEDLKVFSPQTDITWPTAP